MPKLHIDNADVTLVVLLLIGLGVLIVCSIIVIKPFLTENSLRPANCTLEGLRYHGDHVTGSRDICLIITVSYMAMDEDGVLKVSNATLYGSVESINNQCSVTNRNYLDNRVGSWRQNSTGPCWFNPQNTSQVLARREHSYWGTVHSALWPSIVILGSGSLFMARRCTPRLEE